MRLASTVAAIALVALTATATLAAGPEVPIVAQLQQEGYTIQLVSTTLLGRVHIDAIKGSMRREIVINPRTGEVMRDYQTPIMVADGDDGGNITAPATATATDATAAADPVEPSPDDIAPDSNGGTSGN